uniref:Merozoite surface protein 8 n=1 Tax=Caenorhabditis tropicalis TaxID=1561998 RepID=A0A1I7UZ43_9PELO
MKVIVVIVLLFIYSTAIDTRVKRGDLTDKEKQGTADEVNVGRRQVANSYSDSMSFPSKCVYKNVGFTFYDDDINFMRNLLKNKQKEFKTNPTQIIQQSENSAYNCINPKQKTIRCKKMDCTVDGRTVHNLPNCVCGPESSLKLEEFDTGKPGSKCPGKVDDGLCVVDTGNLASTVFAFLSLAVFYLIV